MGTTRPFVLTVLLGVGAVAGCSDSDSGPGPDTSYGPEIDPARFASTVDNPFFPLVPGTVLHYTEETEDGTEDITVTVTADTRRVLGVDCVVVHDVASFEGEVTEDTYDWFAQDVDGNVWYFGEDTTAYDGDQSSTAGSWEAGVDGAQPGIQMLGSPTVGARYRQEYRFGEAEDEGEVLALGVSATVPHGSFDDCIRTRDTTRLEPHLVEEKIYCRGVGLVQADAVAGELEHLELVSAEAP